MTLRDTILLNRMISLNHMFTKTLAPATEQLLNNLAGKTWLKKYYLAGGTALALHFGHRQSVDLDWFSPQSIQLDPLIKNLSSFDTVEIVKREKNTLEALLAGVKVSFMTYPYPLLKKTFAFSRGVALAAPLDIALMKLGAIADRNTKKDFIDLYIFLERTQLTLAQLMAYLPNKFPSVAYDRYHLFKSLTYFVEADTETMPKMLIKLNWKKVKQFFIAEVRKLEKDI